ncbi:MAG: thioredoxin family protein [Desulfobulbaceae bacterium A2]|nr:MAG: thioredoxin family protein [Desulfobulbaceae bacterium A2]
MQIKVLGPGCTKCKEAERLVQEAVATAGVTATVEKVSDFAEIAKCGVFATPAVVIDGQVKCVGRVPSQKEVLDWIK